MTINTNDIINAMNWRSAVKVFIKDKKVEPELLNTILEAGRLAPSAYGLQPIRIVDLSSNAGLREKIKVAGYGQNQITDAPHLFVITGIKDPNQQFIHNFVELTSNIRNIPIENLKGYEDMMVGDIATRSAENKFAWSGRQAYLAFGTMITTAALLGVDVGPMEGFNNQQVDEILELDQLGLTSFGLMAVGYRDEEADSWHKMPKVRISKKDLIITK